MFEKEIEYMRTVVEVAQQQRQHEPTHAVRNKGTRMRRLFRVATKSLRCVLLCVCTSDLERTKARRPTTRLRKRLRTIAGPGPNALDCCAFIVAPAHIRRLFRFTQARSQTTMTRDLYRLVHVHRKECPSYERTQIQTTEKTLLRCLIDCFVHKLYSTIVPFCVYAVCRSRTPLTHDHDDDDKDDIRNGLSHTQQTRSRANAVK